MIAALLLLVASAALWFAVTRPAGATAQESSADVAGDTASGPTGQTAQEAIDAHIAATDGPEQPIPFNHRFHSTELQMDCEYCHSGSDRSQTAGVPSVQVCMGCHAQFPPSYDELEGIRTLKEYWERKQPIEWLQVHRLPEHVQFRHNGHVRKGFDCQTCHGPVEQMDKVFVLSDTRWWPWLLPTRTLEMGWCVDCHRQNAATDDCFTCHY